MSPRILLKPHRVELFEKHSRFIGIGYPCPSLDEFKQCKEALELEFSDASHITYAYKIIDNAQVCIRYSDAGEPSGTAGRPILAHIEGQDLFNIALFVVRYFGGVKLGAGGLVRAYGNTARQFMLEAPLVEHVPTLDLILQVPFSEQNHLDYLLRKHAVTLLDRQFSDFVRCHVRLALKDEKAFVEALGNSIQILQNPGP